MYMFRTILFICGFYTISIVQKGEIEKEDDAPIYIFAPHTSLFDVLAGLAFDAPSSVAKADIIDIPFFGNIFKLTDPVLVERNSKDSRKNVLKKVAETIEFSKIVFFPEGTCSNHRGLLQFKNGAFKFGYPVIPVALRFNQFGGPDTLSWTWDGPNTMASMWFTLARWRTHLELTKLPVYYPNEDEKLDPDLYALNVAKVLERELNIPCLFYSFDDSKYLKYKFFRSSTCVKFLKLCDKIRPYRTKETPEENCKRNSSLKSPKVVQNKPETLFTEFLKQYIGEIRQNLQKHDPSSHLTQSVLIDVLNAGSVPDIQKSFSLNEFLFCLQKAQQRPSILHLNMILDLVDLTTEDLWERLKNAYNKMTQNDEIKLSQFDLKTILWYSLNLEDIDKDDDVNDIFILSFNDLKNTLISYYGFAIRENAPAVYQESYNKPQPIKPHLPYN